MSSISLLSTVNSGVTEGVAVSVAVAVLVDVGVGDSVDTFNCPEAHAAMARAVFHYFIQA